MRLKVRFPKCRIRLHHLQKSNYRPCMRKKYLTFQSTTVGVILIGVITSFIYDKVKDLPLATSLKQFLLLDIKIWIVLTVVAFCLLLIFLFRRKLAQLLGYGSGIKNNYSKQFNSTKVSIIIGNIEDANGITKNGAFILPANTTFADKCVEDPNSALGAFFRKHHHDKISDFPKNIKKILEDNGLAPNEKGYYKSGTAIILPEEYSMPAKVILVASSVLKEGVGFRSDHTLVTKSVHNVFKEIADKKIDTLYFPIIGSGHAGLELTDALCLLLWCIKYQCKHFHFAKNIYIFIRESDNKKINNSFLNCL